MFQQPGYRFSHSYKGWLIFKGTLLIAYIAVKKNKFFDWEGNIVDVPVNFVSFKSLKKLINEFEKSR
jgi:hypothetical protein